MLLWLKQLVNGFCGCLDIFTFIIRLACVSILSAFLLRTAVH